VKEVGKHGELVFTQETRPFIAPLNAQETTGITTEDRHNHCLEEGGTRGRNERSDMIARLSKYPVH
jgi:hypothetical protein